MRDEPYVSKFLLYIALNNSGEAIWGSGSLSREMSNFQGTYWA